MGKVEACPYGGCPRCVADDAAANLPAATTHYGNKDGLTFDSLQLANNDRGKVWGNGQEIPYLFNAVELGGETGELIEALEIGLYAAAIAGRTLNAVKKYYRGEIGIAGGEPKLDAIRDELGDVVICCSLLANKLGINLGQAVADKFNKTSEKHGFPHRLAA